MGNTKSFIDYFKKKRITSSDKEITKDKKSLILSLEENEERDTSEAYNKVLNLICRKIIHFFHKYNLGEEIQERKLKKEYLKMKNLFKEIIKIGDSDISYGKKIDKLDKLYQKDYIKNKKNIKKLLTEDVVNNLKSIDGLKKTRILNFRKETDEYLKSNKNFEKVYNEINLIIDNSLESNKIDIINNIDSAEKMFSDFKDFDANKETRISSLKKQVDKYLKLNKQFFGAKSCEEIYDKISLKINDLSKCNEINTFNDEINDIEEIFNDFKNLNNKKSISKFLPLGKIAIFQTA